MAEVCCHLQEASAREVEAAVVFLISLVITSKETASFNPLQRCACGVILAFENMVSAKRKHTCVCMSNIEAGSIWGYTLGVHSHPHCHSGT